MNEGSGYIAKEELGCDSPTTALNFDVHNKQAEKLIAPETSTNSPKLSSQPLLASSNHLEKNRSLPLSDISKESNWLNKPRIRSFTTSEGIDRKQHSNKSKGALNPMSISSPNVTPTKEKFLQGNRNFSVKG